MMSLEQDKSDTTNREEIVPGSRDAWCASRMAYRRKEMYRDSHRGRLSLYSSRDRFGVDKS